MVVEYDISICRSPSSPSQEAQVLKSLPDARRTAVCALYCLWFQTGMWVLPAWLFRVPAASLRYVELHNTNFGIFWCPMRMTKILYRCSQGQTGLRSKRGGWVPAKRVRKYFQNFKSPTTFFFNDISNFMTFWFIDIIH